MSKTTYPAIRLSITEDVRAALVRAKQMYPALSDPEILKVGLSKIVNDASVENSIPTDVHDIRAAASYAVGDDYLVDPKEDVYNSSVGKRVHF